MDIREIKDTYPLVYALAISHREEISTTFQLAAMFSWSEKWPGKTFWQSIDRRNFEIAHSIHPSLFPSKEEDKRLSIDRIIKETLGINPP